MENKTPIEIAREQLALFEQAELVKPKKVADKKVEAYVASLIAEYGEPHVVTEEDIELNADMKDLAVGELVFIETDKDDDTSPLTTEPTAPSAPTDDSAPIVLDEVTPPAKKQLFYLGKPVTSVTNRIISGKLHKDVSLSVVTYTLTADEYAAQVTEQ